MKKEKADKRTAPKFFHLGWLIPFMLVLSTLFLPFREGSAGSSRSYGPRNIHTRMLENEEIGLFMDVNVTSEKKKIKTGLFSFRDQLILTFELVSVLAPFVTYQGAISFEANLTHAFAPRGNLRKELKAYFDGASSAKTSFTIDSAAYAYDLEFDYAKTAYVFTKSTASVIWLNSGLSGNPFDTFSRVPVTIENFSSFFMLEIKVYENTKRLFICPRIVSSFADYEVALLFEDFGYVSLRRNGTYEKDFLKTGNFLILEINGCIDTYPNG